MPSKFRKKVSFLLKKLPIDDNVNVGFSQRLEFLEGQKKLDIN